MRDMSISVVSDEKVRSNPLTARPYLLSGLAALSIGAAVIHFAVTFSHFQENALYGTFFLIISWAQLIWPVGLFWRPNRSSTTGGIEAGPTRGWVRPTAAGLTAEPSGRYLGGAGSAR